MSKPKHVIRKSVRVKFEKIGGGEISIPAVRTSQRMVKTTPLPLEHWAALVHLQEMKCGVLRVALRDMLGLFERSSGEGWTAADVQRLQEIRQLAK